MIERGRVLVVEDEPLSRDVLVRMLTSRGFEVDALNDGSACMDWLEDHSPDLVLLDVSMPGVSGIQVLEWIRERHSHDQLPVILVTALVDSDDVIAGLNAGANDYVVKPVHLPVLLARIAVALRIKRGVARLVEAERYRVMLESLDGACEELDEPVGAISEDLSRVIAKLPPESDDLRADLTRALEAARKAHELIGRYRKLAAYQRTPYTEGLGGFIAASLERVKGGSAESAPPTPDNEGR